MSTDSRHAVDAMLASGRIPEQLVASVSEFLARGADREHALALLEAYLRRPEWEVEFERALASKEQFKSLSSVASDLVLSGADADQVKLRLEAFHLQLVGQGREHDDDVVLEVLDELVGF